MYLIKPTVHMSAPEQEREREKERASESAVSLLEPKNNHVFAVAWETHVVAAAQGKSEREREGVGR